MTFEEIYSEVSPKTELGKIVKDIYYDDAIPDASKVEVLKSRIKGNTKLIDELDSHFPGSFVEVNKSKGKMAETSASNASVLAGLLGYQSTEALLDKKVGWQTIPGLSIVQKFKEAGIDPYKAMNSLMNLQIARDRKMAAQGFDPETGERSWGELAKYLGRTTFAPRSQEAVEEGKDIGAKEIGMDVGENILFALPYGRALGFIPKVARLGKVGNAFLRGGKEVAANVIAPTVSEVADYIAYDPEENYRRGTFNPGDIALGTATNLATAPAVAGTASALFRRSTLPGANKGQVLDVLVADPVLENRLLREELEGVAAAANPAANLQHQVDVQVVSDVLKNAKNREDVMKNRKLSEKFWDLFKEEPARERMGKEQLKEYQDWLNREPDGLDITTGAKGTSVDLKRQKINQLIDLIQDDKLREAYRKMYNETNPSHVWPTRVLGDKAKDYGISEAGELAFVHHGPAADIPDVHLRPEHGVTIPVVPENRSAATLSENALYKGPDGTWKQHTDVKYPRATEFDKKVEDLMKDPTVVRQAKYGTGFTKALGTNMAKGYVTNKLGKNKYGKSLVGNSLEEDYTNAEIQNILDDEFIIRQWEAGFVPRGGAEKVAYEIWKAQRNKK